MVLSNTSHKGLRTGAAQRHASSRYLRPFGRDAHPISDSHLLSIPAARARFVVPWLQDSLHLRSRGISEPPLQADSYERLEATTSLKRVVDQYRPWPLSVFLVLIHKHAHTPDYTFPLRAAKQTSAMEALAPGTASTRWGNMRSVSFQAAESVARVTSTSSLEFLLCLYVICRPLNLSTFGIDDLDLFLWTQSVLRSPRQNIN